MRKITLTAVAAAALFSFISCKKSDNVSSEKTVQNISGSYNLTGLTWSALGITANVYDSLPPCEKDNIIQLNTDGSAHELDVKIMCDPPEADSVSTWGISSNGDSLYLDHSPYLIKSWDGKTLVITGVVDPGPPMVTGVTTFVKQ
ncbi:MAG: hypothetical protein WDM78_12845 [Puia sp.]